MIVPLALILLLAVMFPINVCVSVESSPNWFEPLVWMVDDVMNDDVMFTVVMVFAVKELNSTFEFVFRVCPTFEA